MSLIVSPREVIKNPSPEDLRRFAAEMPNAVETEYGNICVGTRVVARSKASTYIVTDRPEEHTDQTITRAKGSELAKKQDDYISGCNMIVLDGFIGGDPKTRTAARLIVEKDNANIAAMQRQLYFTPTAAELEHFEPELHVIYTPNLKAEGFPNDRLIAVDLENNVTRVFNSDYFGESKKGGLRMWNKIIYDRGGLALHAGCKIIPTPAGKKVALIIGLSGTGKTTTTFTRQNDSQPVQDDFVALLPGGGVLASENGCFAKTYGLTPETEPEIYNAVIKPQAFLENVSVKDGGKVDFSDDSYTQNGRATFPFSMIEGSADASDVGKVDMILILNRNENIIPAVAKLDANQAAAYFMLGETKGTSAGGIEEAGKALRVPGTNPFFPLRHGQQGARFLELMNKNPIDVYLMNTGWVGGADGTEHSRKVKIRHSSAIVKGLAEGTIDWTKDGTFGYQVASKVEGLGDDDTHLLRPETYYASTGRADEYKTMADALRKSRKTHLEQYKSLDQRFIDAV